MSQGSSAATFLALNSGSSSLKLGLFRAGKRDVELLATGSADGIGRRDGSLHLGLADGGTLRREEHLLETQEHALSELSGTLREHFPDPPSVIGHRFVHGGPKLREHTWLTPEVRQQLEAAKQFAPLHIPLALQLADHASKLYPGAPQVACFDTAFHRHLPPVSMRFPLPLQLFEEGVLRYGFHGLSYESIVHRYGSTLPARAIFAHLGNGSSLAAVLDGRSIDTTMGLTPTGGIPMSTRSGDLDPGVLLFLLRHTDADADKLEAMLNKEAGLYALSGGESDMQVLLEREKSGDAEATLAIDVFCTAVAKTIGAYAALLKGVDLVVFTGGIGEHGTSVRQRICRGLSFLGLPDGTSDAAKLRILPAQEEMQIARHCQALLEKRSEDARSQEIASS